MAGPTKTIEKKSKNTVSIFRKREALLHRIDPSSRVKSMRRLSAITVAPIMLRI
jgi:hypothetical protein